MKEVIIMMQMGTQNGQTKQSQNVSLLMAGVAGLLAGAAGVTALALSDKEIRRKVGKKTRELRLSLQDWSAEKLQMADQQKIEKTETVERVVDNTKEDESFKQEAKIKN